MYRSSVNDYSGSIVGESSQEIAPSHKLENFPNVKKCTDSSVNDYSGSIVGESSQEIAPSHKLENFPNVKKCTDSSVNDYSGSIVGESSQEIAPSHKLENFPNVKKCTDSSVNDYSDSIVGESSQEIAPSHKLENFPNVKECTDSSVSDYSGSTFGKSSTEVTPSCKPENLPSVEKCADSFVNDCSGSTVGESSMEVASSHKPENFCNIKKCTDFSVNGCSGSTVVGCDAETLPKDKVDEDDEDEYICVTDDEPCSGSKWDTSDDLPLMANVDEVLVTHYVLNLSVNFNDKIMSGDITLFLKPATELVTQRQFQLCLDCSLVDIESVEEIDLKDDFSVRQYGPTYDERGCSSYPPDIFQVDKFKKVPVALPYTFLPYAVRNWCVRIWKPCKLGTTWPRCVRIKYCTRPEGKSLTWTTDQDNRCVKQAKND